jgi:hypothetical protein
MAGRLQHTHDRLAQPPLVALSESHVDARDAALVGRAAHHRRAVALLQLQVAANVVPVVVRVQDEVQPQAPACSGGSSMGTSRRCLDGYNTMYG